MTQPNWLENITGPNIRSGSVDIGRMPNLNFVGATVTQDLLNQQNIVNVTGGGSGPSWKTALDFNWTTPGAQTFSSDGAVTFGGLTFYKINSSGEATHASAGGGNGLNFQPTTQAGGTLVGYTSTSRSAPGMWLPASQIAGLATIDWSTPLRFWVSCNSAVFQANSDQAIFAIDQNNLSASFVASYGYPIGGPQTALAIYGGGSNIINNDSTTGPAINSSFIGLIELPFGLAGVTARTFYLTGSASWPAYNQLQPSTVVINAPANSSSPPTRTFGPYGPLNWGFLLMGERGTGNPQHVTYDRMRIDFYQ